MTKEEIRKVLELALEYYKLEIFGTGKESQPPTQERIDYIYDRMQPSLPSNLNEAAIDAAQLDMQDRQIMEATNDERLRYSRIFRRGFKAGTEWMAGQGAFYNTKVGWIDGPTVLDWPDDILDKFEMGDEVIVQIRKK